MSRSQQPVLPEKDRQSTYAQASMTSDVLVFIDDAAVSEASVRHAHKVATAFGGKVILVQVLCKPVDRAGPIDPIEWDIRKQHTLKQLGFLTKGLEGANQPCSIELLEGQCLNKIRAFMEHRQGDIAAIPRTCGDAGWHQNEAAWGVLLSQGAAVLMIPDDTRIEPNARYRQILVPLDGSSRAELALPVATKMALVEKSELVMCYDLPDPGLTEFGSKNPENSRLIELVRQRNERAGRAYLNRIKKRLEHSDLTISIKISQGGDARRALIDIMSREGIDFAVMATHGQGGHRDVPTGDVARFVLDKAEIPVLLVRTRNGRDSPHAFDKVSSKGVRQPTGTD